MENADLLKHIAKLEAKCNTLEKIVFELKVLNKNIVFPPQKNMDEEYNEQLKISETRYKLL